MVWGLWGGEVVVVFDANLHTEQGKSMAGPDLLRSNKLASRLTKQVCACLRMVD